jgi:hypothetical protein
LYEEINVKYYQGISCKPCQTQAFSGLPVVAKKERVDIPTLYCNIAGKFKATSDVFLRGGEVHGIYHHPLFILHLKVIETGM